MTEEQKAKRKESAESGKIKWIKDNCLRTKDGSEDYVFISYKSDDYEKVLDGIVYDTCRKYGLRVYFDTAFDDNSDSWITQFQENMNSTHCKAMIAFIDNAYYSSYATLMEMMARRVVGAGGDGNYDSLPFIPVNLEAIKDINSCQNTGLGTYRFSDGTINELAEPELEKFNKLFNQIVDYEEENGNKTLKHLYERSTEPVIDANLYREKTDNENESGKVFLTETFCRKIMGKIMPFDNKNDGTNKDFVEAIHDKLKNKGITSVFGEKITASSELNNLPKNIKGQDTEIVSGKAYLEAVKALVESHPELIDNWKVGQIYSTKKENSKQQKECELSNGKIYYINLNININVMKKNYSDMLKYLETEDKPARLEKIEKAEVKEAESLEDTSTDSADYVVTETMIKHHILQLGAAYDVGPNVNVTIVFNDHEYNTKSHSVNKGRFDNQIGRLIKENELKLGEELSVSLDKTSNRIILKRI